MSNGSDNASEISPLRKLLIAVLLSVVLAQVAAMTLLLRSQVQKAQLRAMLESAGRTEASQTFENAGKRRPNMTVGYVPGG